MCTVTFIPVRDSYFITSNRDEKICRKTAVPPGIYGKLIFPKDVDAGGTWIAIHENGNVAVLLNGAFEKHTPNPPYKQSRGITLLSIIGSNTPIMKFVKMDLTGIEPFTTVIIAEGNLYECCWDGNMKYGMKLRKHRPYIWSSATLYDRQTRLKREQWFVEFLHRNPDPKQEDILHFHLFSGEGDANNDLQMSRANLYSTVSITAISLTAGYSSMKYLDLRNGKNHEQGFKICKTFELT
jgi:uncharacterized protein with NRDE domain